MNSGKSHKKWVLSIGVGIGTIGIMSISIWFLKQEIHHNYNLQSAQITQKAQSKSQESMNSHLEGLHDISKLYESLPSLSEPEFKNLAVRVLNKNPGFIAINYIDYDFNVKHVYPYAPNRTAIGLNIKSRHDVLPAANKAITSKNTSATPLINLTQGGNGVHFYSPIFQENRWAGLIEGALKIFKFSKDTIEKTLSEDLGYTIIDETNGRELYTSLIQGVDRSITYDTYFTLKAGDRTWWVILHSLSQPLVLIPVVLILLAELSLGALAIRFVWERSKRYHI